MSCKSCKERRQKLKAMYEQSIESITKVITYLTNKGGKTEQSPASADEPEQRIIVNTRRAGRAKQP
jgi:rhamnose utilization protein RhaD (predicted bifunctional aldolase and dehydrogenase)